MDILYVAKILFTYCAKYPAEKLGEKITTECNKFLGWFNKPHETTEKEIEALANQNPQFEQDVINLVEVLKKEYPTKFQSIMGKPDENKSQETKTEKNNTVIQGNNISGNVGNSGGTQIGTQNNTTYNTHNTNI